MSLTPGTKLGPYEILAAIGAGGMGEVYRARDGKLDRGVAIKVLPEAFAQDADRLARFEREAKAVAALSHPNILAIHDFGNEAGIVYAVTELLEGETLRDQLGRGRLPARKAIEYGIEVARGLAAAHDKGITHRDLKPENLFVTEDGRIKILDFGLAKMEHAHGESDASNSSVRLSTASRPRVRTAPFSRANPSAVQIRVSGRGACLSRLSCSFLTGSVRGQSGFPPTARWQLRKETDPRQRAVVVERGDPLVRATKLGPPSRVTLATNSMMACFAGPSAVSQAVLFIAILL